MKTILCKDIKHFYELCEKYAIKQNGSFEISDYEWLRNELSRLEDEGIKVSIFTEGYEEGYYVSKGYWRINRVAYIVFVGVDIILPEDCMDMQ